MQPSSRLSSSGAHGLSMSVLGALLLLAPLVSPRGSTPAGSPPGTAAPQTGLPAPQTPPPTSPGVVDLQQTFTLPDTPAGKQATFGFVVSDDNTAPEAISHQVFAPDGSEVPAESVSIDRSSWPLAKLRVVTSAFPSIGAYTVFITGSIKGVDKRWRVTINRPAAQFGTIAQGLSCVVQRPGPVIANTSVLGLPLHNTASTNARKVVVAPVAVTGANGQIIPCSLLLRERDSGALWAPSCTIETIPAGSTRLVDIQLGGLKSAGDHVLRLSCTSPSLAQPQTVDLHLHVRDAWLVPLLVLLISVFASAVMHWMAERIRPVLMARYRVEGLRAQLAELRPAMSSPVNRQKLDDTELAIAAAEGLLGLGDTVHAALSLDQAATSIQQFRTEDAARRQKMESDLSSLEQQIAAALAKAEGPPPSAALDAARKDLSAATDGVTAAKQLLSEGRTDAAEAAWKKEHANLAEILRRYQLVDSAAAAPSGAPDRADTAGKRKRLVWGIDAGQYAVTAVLAVVTGMYTLYWGQDFGTWHDYAGLVVWAFGVAASPPAIVTIGRPARGTSATHAGPKPHAGPPIIGNPSAPGR